MENNDTKQWKKNVGLEIQKISTIIRNLGFSLDQNQPHVSGERFLMTKDKLVLVGKRASDDLRVVVKASSHKGGEQEIRNEKKKVFVEHSAEEQFFLILRAFESQEAFHATTFEHMRQVASVFPIFDAQKYLKEFQNFKATISANYHHEEIQRTLEA